jgi:sporulation protein YlmC with PRC-barrel domain
MITQNQVRDLIGSQLVGSDGQKIGKVGQIFLDDQTGKPEWATVNTGFFGSSESFVPLADADVQGDAVRVPYTKDQIKDAPNVDVDNGGHLSQSEERNLYRHYGLSYSEQSSDSGLPGSGTQRTSGRDTGTARGAGHDTWGPTPTTR